MTADLSPLDHLPAATTALLATAAKMDDLAAPSLCGGWSRAHVLSHLARNADGLMRLVRAAGGSGETMYDSAQSRDADIEAGAARSRDLILADLGGTARAVDEALAGLSGDLGGTRVERTPGGPSFHARNLPFMRLREVVYHHVDLDAGPTFGDLPDDLVAAFLADEITRLRGAPHVPGLTIRTTEGDAWAVGDGSADVTGTRAGVLAWLARGIPDGIDQDNPPTLPEGR